MSITPKTPKITLFFKSNKSPSAEDDIIDTDAGNTRQVLKMETANNEEEEQQSTKDIKTIAQHDVDVDLHEVDTTEIENDSIIETESDTDEFKEQVP